jgi:GxxExxY protein
MNPQELNKITAAVIKAAIAVHKALGPGLLESVYERCMVLELRAMGHKVESQVPIPVFYRGVHIDDRAFRMDLLVDDEVVAELKSCEEIRPVFQKTLLTYLRLAKKQVGLVINFNVPLLKDGIVRVVDGLDETPCHESASPIRDN